MPKRGDTGGHHNEGQEDASKGKFDPPHERPLGFYDDKEIEDRDAYREGWRHTKDQEDSSSSGGCFLTTACVTHAGLGDNCLELVTLREFRDRVLAKSDAGRRKIAEYYDLAPRLVAQIDESPRKTEIYVSAFRDIRQVVSLIQAGDHKSALGKYESLIRSLVGSL